MSETRKARRLASNRESARRSRVRRRRQLDELSAITAELRATNQRLVVELNRAEARYAQVARENARLREEASRLREKLAADDAEQTDEAGGDDGDEAAARTP
jgi:predicted nuclease with TOPRIM domain